MPETKKKPKKPRAKRLKSKKGLKQKQKQKQQVTVNVSAGGSGGGGYVPIPQSPSIDYGLISQLLRPAATTDVPIRAAAPVAEMPFVRPAEPESLASEKSKRSSSAGAQTDPVSTSELGKEIFARRYINPVGSGAYSGLEIPSPYVSENEGEFMVAKARKVRSDAGKSRKKPSQESTLAEMERQQKELAREGDVGRRFERLPAIQRAGFASLGDL